MRARMSSRAFERRGRRWRVWGRRRRGRKTRFVAHKP